MIEMFHKRTLLLLVGLTFCGAYVADKNSMHVPKAYSMFGPSIEKAKTADQELYRIFSQQDFKCTSVGRFEDPDDCGQYYDCIKTNTGELMAHKKSCFDHDFDSTIKACVHTKMVNGCSPSPTKSERTFHFSNTKLQKVCKEAKNEFMCSDCKTLVMCVEGEAFKDPCGPGLFCSMNKTAFTGGVCYPDGPSECTCNKDNIFRKDMYNPSKFLSCDTEGSDPELHTCPGGRVFNEEHRSCGTQAESTCSITGSFPMMSDCTKFYTCILTTEGWLQKEFSCPHANTMFNEKTGVCEDPCSWYTGSFTCKNEGRFANPGDCSTFYECIKDTLNSSKFIQIQHTCPAGYEWGTTGNRSFCVPSSSTTNECVPTKPNGCKIPSGWCPSSTENEMENQTSTQSPTHLCDNGNNGGCDQLCNKVGDEVMCACNESFSLGKDNKTCNPIPDGFEKLEDGRVIRRTVSSDPKSKSYDEQMDFCNVTYGAQPFVPRTPADYLIYKQVRESFDNGGHMWLPVNDRQQEGTLRWTNGELAVNTTLFRWRDGKELTGNAALNDCVFYGCCRFENAKMYPDVYLVPCDREAYPPICEII